MSKTTLAGALVASVLLALPLAASADSGHGDKADSASEGGHSGAHGGHGASTSQPASLAGAWTALMAARDDIASDVESGALGEVHAKVEPLPKLVAALLEQSGDLDADKRTRVEGAAKQVTRVAEALHVAADRDDAARTRKELSRLDSLLELLRAQYPTGALDAGIHGQEGHSAAPGHADGAHAHMERPAGVVDATPQATVRIQAFDRLRFEPKRIEVQAGVPTRIELENVGAAEHTLVVKTPDGTQDWVHLHAPPGMTEAATYRLDEPGRYPVLCTIPGHTEGGMIGELVVVAGHGPAHSHH
ncbi:MAG: cupredoxin domain-containing protein [Myxococcota bacterium]